MKCNPKQETLIYDEDTEFLTFDCFVENVFIQREGDTFNFVITNKGTLKSVVTYTRHSKDYKLVSQFNFKGGQHEPHVK